MSLTTSGNLDISTSTNFYSINGSNILGHKGNVSNIFVGVNAGGSSGNLASHNTYMGNAAGFTGTGIRIDFLTTMIKD